MYRMAQRKEYPLQNIRNALGKASSLEEGTGLKNLHPLNSKLRFLLYLVARIAIPTRYSICKTVSSDQLHYVCCVLLPVQQHYSTALTSTSVPASRLSVPISL